jgi:hypothetical protein
MLPLCIQLAYREQKSGHFAWPPIITLLELSMATDEFAGAGWPTLVTAMVEWKCNVDAQEDAGGSATQQHCKRMHAKRTGVRQGP